MKRLIILLVLTVASLAYAAPVCDLCGADAQETYFFPGGVYFDGGGYPSYRAEAISRPLHLITLDIRVVLCDSCSLMQDSLEADLLLLKDSLLKKYYVKVAKRSKRIAKMRASEAKADTLRRIAELEKEIRILKNKPLPADTATPPLFYLGGSILRPNTVSGQITIDTLFPPQDSHE